MYKVFFQDRIIYVTEDFRSHFFNDYGLFYKYYDQDELADLLKLFTVLTKIKKLYLFHNNLEQAWSGFTRCFCIIEAAGGIIYNDRNQVLVLKRRDKWDFPKGKIEEGESSESAALREAREETGIVDLKITRPLQITYHIYEQDGIPILKSTQWYSMSTSGPAEPIPESEEDITEAIWFDQKELSKIISNTYLGIVDLLQNQNLLEF